MADYLYWNNEAYYRIYLLRVAEMCYPYNELIDTLKIYWSANENCREASRLHLATCPNQPHRMIFSTHWRMFEKARLITYTHLARIQAKEDSLLQDVAKDRCINSRIISRWCFSSDHTESEWWMFTPMIFTVSLQMIMYRV